MEWELSMSLHLVDAFAIDNCFLPSSPLGSSQATGSQLFQLLKGFGKVLVELGGVFRVDIDPLEETLVL